MPLLPITVQAGPFTLRPCSWLLSSARGKGVGATALAALSRFGLGQFARLELYIEPWNEASWRTAERVGFRREGLMRKFQNVDGERKDMYLYALLPGDLSPD